jgi:hypothetical protein
MPVIVTLTPKNSESPQMNTSPVPPTHRQVNWVPMPDPVTEIEVNIDLKWTADPRTQLAIQRQTKLMGFESADDYLRQIIAKTIASNEADTIITSDGRLVSGPKFGYYRDGEPQDV